jgi:hypothetical protein
MLDPCSPVARVICGLALLVALVTLILSARLLRVVLRESKRLRDKVEPARKISAGEIPTAADGERFAVLPPDPRGRP